MLAVKTADDEVVALLDRDAGAVTEAAALLLDVPVPLLVRDALDDDVLEPVTRAEPVGALEALAVALNVAVPHAVMPDEAEDVKEGDDDVDAEMLTKGEAEALALTPADALNDAATLPELHAELELEGDALSHIENNGVAVSQGDGESDGDDESELIVVVLTLPLAVCDGIKDADTEPLIVASPVASLDTMAEPVILALLDGNVECVPDTQGDGEVETDADPLVLTLADSDSVPEKHALLDAEMLIDNELLGLTDGDALRIAL